MNGPAYVSVYACTERATAGARGGAIPRERGQEIDSQMEG